MAGWNSKTARAIERNCISTYKLKCFCLKLKCCGDHLPLCCHQDLEELDPDFIMAKQVEQLEKEKKELQERLKNQEKKVKERVDFFLEGFVLAVFF